MCGLGVGGVGFQSFQQKFPVEYVDSHRSHGSIRIARHGLRIDRFFIETGDAMFAIDGHHPKAGGFMQGHLDHTDGYICLFLGVKSDHRAVVHFIDMVAGQDQHMLRLMLSHQIQILEYRIGCALVPVFTHLLLGGNNLDKLTKLTPEKGPAPVYMLDQRMCFVLCEHKYLPNARIHTVGERKIDNSEFPAERSSGFCTDFGEIPQS